MNFYNLIPVVVEPILDFQRIPYALAAVFFSVILGLVTGGARGTANPLFWQVIDRSIGSFGDRLDRTHRVKADLVFRGFVLSALGVIVAFLYLALFLWLRRLYPSYGLIDSVFLTTLVTSGGVWHALSRLYVVLEQKKPGQGGYLVIARTTRSNLTLSDDYGISRIGIGLAAWSFDRGMIGPIFWYLIGGIPLALLYCVFAALAWRFGKDGFTKGFGSFALLIERVMGFMPSLLTALFIIIAGLFTPTANPFRGLRFFGGLKNRAPYEQGGFPLSALAWTLNISLGGPYQDLQGSAIQSVWVGPAGVTAKTDHKNLRRAIFISVMAHALLVLVLGAGYWWIYRRGL